MSDVSGEFLESVRAEQASEVEPETTTEQLAEIEGQATAYAPPDGWRLLEAHEEVDIPGRDQYIIGPNRYIRRIEWQPQPEPQPEAETVQVREGRWRTRNGDIRNVTPTPAGHGREERFPWWDATYRQTWRANGRYHFGEEGPLDLVTYLGAIETEPEPQAETDGELRIRLLKDANDTQAETIGRLLCQARDLKTEIGGLERQLVQRDARIQDLETLHAAATQAVADAGKVNDQLRALANNLRQQFEAAASEISEQRAYLDKYDKQVDQKDAQIRDLRIELDAAQQLQQANDKMAQLEALQPMAAACSTVQTMVRDMLGHMRCLVSLNSTTDRSNFCTLLESILEVFDDAECDDDGDETSEAEQG